MSPAASTVMAFFVFFFVLGVTGMFVRPSRAKQGQVAQPPRTFLWWLKAGMIFAAAVYVFQVVGCRHLVQGPNALELVLGQLLGAPLFGPLSARILRKTVFGYEELCVMIMASQVSGPLLAYAIVTALGLPGHNYSWIAGSLVR